MIKIRHPPSSSESEHEQDDFPKEGRENSIVDADDGMFHWYGAKFLYAANTHVRDKRVRYVDHRRFYIRWQEVRDSEVTYEDTVSVTTLADPYNKTTSTTTDREQARQQGLLLHRVLECYYNGFCSTLSVLGPVLRPIVESYIKDIGSTLTPWRTEMAIFSDIETRIVGVVDIIYVDTDRDFMEDEEDQDVLYIHLRDWKYSSNCPLQTTQLNLYRYLLEEYYHDITYQGRVYTRFRVRSMALIYFHETYGYKQVDVHRTKEEVDSIIDQRCQQLK
jgi:hypothetical protein